MTSFNEQDWPQQEPPPDFAARAVEAMLQPSPPQLLQARRRRRLLGLWSLAAIFVTGAALASWSHYRSGRPDVPRAAALQPLPTLSVPTALKAPAIAVVRVPEPAASAPAPKARHGISRPTKVPPRASSMPHPLRAPACQCERGFADFMCDCY